MDDTGRFPLGGGDMGAAIRSHDWSSASIGPSLLWPEALRNALNLMLNSPESMYLVWGSDLTFFFNDAYRPILGPRLDSALGASLPVLWSDAWDAVREPLQRAFAGEASRFVDVPIAMARQSHSEETWWTYSFSPIYNGARVEGVFCYTVETTSKVLAERRREQGETDVRAERDRARRSEASAHVNAERVQLALAAGAIIGTWFWDLPTDRFTVDEAFAHSFGLDPELGREGLSLEQVIATVHPDDREGLIGAITDVIARSGAYAHQYRVRRADGRYYWIEANGRVDHAPDGTPLSFPGVLIDVEDRRAVEAERDRAIARLRALNSELEQKVIAQSLARGRTWQVSPDILGVVNSAGYFEASNPAWEAVLGWSEDEVATTLFFDFIHPDDQAQAREAWSNASRLTHSAVKLENRFRHRDGGWRWLSWVAVPDDNKIYCSARDITAQKESEAALAAKTLERDRLWETTNDLMGTAGLDGFLKSLNPAWGQLLGWSETELLERPFLQIIDPEDHTEATNVLARLAKGEALSGFVDRMICKDGSKRTVMWSGSSDLDAGIFHMVGRDITDLRAAENSLRQSQKMEAVGQLTGGLAHDFNNLLAAISGSLELMSKRITQGRYSDVDRYVGIAQSATKRAAALTHRLLAFSRRQTLDPKISAVDQVVTDMIDLVQRTVGPAVRVDTISEEDLWSALVDVSQLENALLNLCINGRDAMPDGGSIVIETRNIQLNREDGLQLDLASGEYVVLSVTDTGTGMAPDVIAKAFDPFFTTKPLGEGTGLGLSMIYGFATQSGGRVAISSKVGEGTTVSIYLPRHEGEEEIMAAEGTTVSSSAPLSIGTVLVVDDEAMVRMLVTDVLAEQGYDTLEAEDGPSALNLLRSDLKIDLLVTDVGLPNGINGRQLADAARFERPGLKIMFITGYAENSLLSNGQLDEGMAVLTKPFAVEALSAKVREMFAGA